MKQSIIYASYLSVIFALSSSVLAEEHMEQHGVHEHGVATLSIAVGDEGLEIMLETPAVNLLGFEHAASTVEEKQQLADIKARLEAGDELFSINAESDCGLKDVEVSSALMGDAAQEEAGSGHEQADEGEEAHHDVDAVWSYVCTKPAELKAIAVKLFSAFPQGFQKINAEWVSDQGASAQALDKDAILKISQ